MPGTSADTPEIVDSSASRSSCFEVEMGCLSLMTTVTGLSATQRAHSRQRKCAPASNYCPGEEISERRGDR